MKEILCLNKSAIDETRKVFASIEVGLMTVIMDNGRVTYLLLGECPGEMSGVGDIRIPKIPYSRETGRRQRTDFERNKFRKKCF